MKPRTAFMLKAAGLFILAFLIIIVAGGCWITRTEDICWRHEAVEAFEKYGSLRTRSEIVRAADIEDDPGAGPVEFIEKEYNGCSLGSNGRTVVRFSFDSRNKLTKIQVFRDYIAADYTMELIEERIY